jgi:pimeloyl-ACP methyl ester carboxylesterase
LTARSGDDQTRRVPTAALPSGIELTYDTVGSPADPALVLVMGLGAQMTLWDEGLCARLAAAGRYVIRFDNRDVGLSTKMDGAVVDPFEVMVAQLEGRPLPAVPYTLSTLAVDTVGLLDHLGIAQAHIVGASMGGMIAQTIAIEHPDRVITLTSIMSTTGETTVGEPDPTAIAALLAPPSPVRETYVANAVESWRVLASPRYYDADMVRDRAGAQFDRSYHPEGTTRQLAAIFASGDRVEGLRALRVPTLVIHGRADRLITLSGGERTAELVPGANLLVLNDMGHDLPEPLWPIIVDAIVSHTTHQIA